MAGSAFLNIPLIKAAIRDAEQETLDEIGERTAADARHRAPIRKVFREKPGFRRKFRPLTQAEKSQAIARANNYYGKIAPNEFKRRRAVAYIASYGRAQIRRPGSNNAVGRSRELRLLGIETGAGARFTSTSGARRLRGGGFEPGPAASEAMTSRGRAETRSGSAIHRVETGGGEVTQVRVGGALKASIESDGAVQTSTGMSVTVAARIRYAKFVEFPTVRTAAQPFLLPALHGQRQHFVGLFATNLRRALGGR